MPYISQNLCCVKGFRGWESVCVKIDCGAQRGLGALEASTPLEMIIGTAFSDCNALRRMHVKGCVIYLIWNEQVGSDKL